uniref:Beta-ketoacyl-[acyl-carrier-protein] synthase III n=1 Tax=Paulinella chromatophora TaxID=39717 RepID=B1X480_PAUCH|nr:3-oxoacyl-(acyl carrier protein) synthase [Paulinella chromatophora]ACB42749.1 3-oxoacyl-(acyl carrier protein) synthase [Paulinella chromatophora]|eukprot:gb/GEZN01000477.1/.p2 GENE.gb/GEZN01000477.1/~~gb/GEZN01000477.1/.p2  ORF type:complete len:330 (-),score=2.27 gb/GEZN01000477.1/:1016-2005(-)
MALVGCGSDLPTQIITNEALSQRVNTNDEWIRNRTGITTRRIAGPGETITTLGLRAGQAALHHAGWSAKDLDLILLATSTPDDLFGSAPKIQGELGATQAVAFDITAACSGFLFALITAGQYFRSGSIRRALIIGADQLSRWVNWDDRRTCILFGDGAAAVAVEECPTEENGLLGFRMRSDGSRTDCLNLRQIPDIMPLINQSKYQMGGFNQISMNGQEVYKFAVREIPAVLQELLIATNINSCAIDWLLLHQANQRILNAVADRFDIPHEKVLTNLAHYGNTSAATIPLMLDEAVKDGRIQSGNLIASSGFGAGLSWGAALLRWKGPG